MKLTERLLESPVLPRDTVCTVAFSGGADSAALLLGLWELREQCRLTLRAVHVHHGIRGAEADRDAAFCAAFCKARGIPFQCVYVNVPKYAAAHRLSPETAARRLRYAALEQAAPDGVIAAAHHAGDNAETMLFHLIRGTGLRGLCGIPEQNGRLIRPMLHAEKQEILDFLAERGQNYVTDSSNFSGGNTRSRIRQQLMPLLKQENPAVIRHLSRTAELLRADDDYLTKEAEAEYRRLRMPSGDTLRTPAALPEPIRMRIYMLRLRQLGIDPSYERLRAIDAAVLRGSGKTAVTRSVYAQVSRRMLYIGRRSTPLAERLTLTVGENRLFPEKCCIASLQPTAISQTPHKNNIQYSLDFDKINGTPYFRQWNAGDRILLAGQTHSSSVKKRIQEKLPAPERRRLYVLYDDTGCILCEGVGIAQRVLPDEHTRRILTLDIVPDSGGSRRDLPEKNGVIVT